MSVQAKLAALACRVAPGTVRPAALPTQFEVVRQTLRGIALSQAPGPAVGFGRPDVCAAKAQAFRSEDAALLASIQDVELRAEARNHALGKSVFLTCA